jgi:hypothetical protein
MFLGNVANKTMHIHNDAQTEGQSGGELAMTTTLEGSKELAKASAVWLAGDVGANLGSRFVPIEIEALGKFKSLPRRSAAIMGAVFVGATMNWLVESILPTRSRVQLATEPHDADVPGIPDVRVSSDEDDGL